MIRQKYKEILVLWEQMDTRVKRKKNLQAVDDLETEKSVCRTLLSVEGVELVEAEPAALLVAQRRRYLVPLQPGSDARKVILVDERQTVCLERTAEVDGDNRIGIIVRDGDHLDGKGAVVPVALEGESDFSVIELVGFHGQNWF